ncbi:MAG TPA: c-type cytochrome [Polyangiaceae bacterium]|jgi:mono/diheme cytochrome c family protein|nr:c-type cytochrome [Polyangiaceae bacterium]
MTQILGRFAKGCMLAVLLIGCQKAPPPAPTATVEAPPIPTAIVLSPSAEARHIFDTRCVVCHGSIGQGDGPGGAVLNPKPRAFADVKWQKSVDDPHIAKTIVEGGLAVGLSAGMAPNPDLKDKPEVVTELIKIVRNFAGK